VVHYDEKLEQENRDLKQIIREELAAHDQFLAMYDGFDELFVANALEFLSGSDLRSVVRSFDRILNENSTHLRERGQLAVICRLFSELSTHIDQDRLSMVQERVKFFEGVALVESSVRHRAPA
jgi:hypothetical protein